MPNMPGMSAKNPLSRQGAGTPVRSPPEPFLKRATGRINWTVPPRAAQVAIAAQCGAPAAL